MREQRSEAVTWLHRGGLLLRGHTAALLFGVLQRPLVPDEETRDNGHSTRRRVLWEQNRLYERECCAILLVDSKVHLLTCNLKQNWDGKPVG